MFDEKRLAARIRQYRMARGLKQGELAEALYVSPQTVSKWENALTVPDIANLCRLAGVLGVPTDALLAEDGQEESERVYIGIDGGGTKTEGVLTTEDGHILRRAVLEGSNPTTVGIDTTLSIVIRLVDALTVPNVTVCGAFAGIAGCGKAGRSERVRTVLRQACPFAKVGAGSDAMNIINLTDDGGDCLAAICGTGSFVFTKHGDEFGSMGGWGQYLDTAGSGYDIGRETIRAALSDIEGLGPHTRLTAAVEEKCEGNIYSRVTNVTGNLQTYFASFAPLAFDACRAGDAVAREIIHASAARIAELIRAASARYKAGNRVILAGGLAKNEEIFLPMIRAELGAEFTLILPSLPQIYGATAAARRLTGALPAAFRRNFEKDYTKLLND